MNVDAQSDLARKISAEIDEHNPSRTGHGERVSSYAVATGYAMGIRDSELRNLRYAALMHDVWKLEVHTSILERQGPLHESELATMRNWPSDFVSRHDLGFEDVSFAIQHQYAHWDGSGTPSASGNDISLAARIIAVAVAFDVMTTPQPWRECRSETDAIQELQRCCGTQFAPDVVIAFLQVQPVIQPVTHV